MSLISPLVNTPCTVTKETGSETTSNDLLPAAINDNAGIALDAAKSRLPDTIALIRLDEVPKSCHLTSRPFFLKIPLSMPTQTGKLLNQVEPP